MERVSNEELTPIQILQRRLRCMQVAQLVRQGRVPSGGSNTLKFYLDSLREYLDKHKLFDYYHGFLCVHVVMRVFQMCILSNFNALGPQTFSDLEPDKDDASNSLVKLTSICIKKSLHPELYKDALGYHKSTTGTTIFQNGGGFTLEDAESMLDWLWKERKAFMVICAEIKMRGWTALFFGLWGLLRESVRAYENCKRIRHLLMRYALCATSEECNVIADMMVVMEQEFRIVGAECQFEVPPLDREDGQNILDTFKDYLVPTKSIIFPFELIYNASLHTRPEEVSSLLITIMDHTWKTLEYERPDWKEKYCDSFYYGARIITSLNDAITHFSYGCIKNKHASIDAYFGVINRINFLELIGRLCLIMVIQSKDNFIIPKYYAEAFYYNMNRLMASFSRAADNNEYVEAPGLQETWDKLLRFIDLHWLVIGKAFEFQRQTSLRRRCMNPRCPNPDMIGGAQEAVHWDRGLPGSHSAQCIPVELQG
ncbi:hypothetical protein RSOLAG22IIIB_07786 [Rhizoctonia solani]|uniref:Uncharacterized protein n=1 Tax=Rhizoctonia solani TaxID=456999 RepID=A0A0K6FPU7_9AGAM|nr:hypothetical protein RSOLAG22IIIB_07786 [Rhizoctonia solani]